MLVTREEALHVAALARLQLEPEELERFTKQLSSILSHVAELADAGADTIDAQAAAAEWDAPLRADTEGADALVTPPAQLAPAWMSGFFTVPRLAALDADAHVTRDDD